MKKSTSSKPTLSLYKMMRIMQSHTNFLLPTSSLKKKKKKKHSFVSRYNQMSNMGRVFALSFVLLLLLGNGVAEDMLFNGESLNAGDFIENGPYRFVMQNDCNLVLYVNQTRALWSSRTNGRGTTCRATLQNNGNLVVLLGGDVVWNSNSARGPNTYRLIVQSDGNVVIYGAALWATNTVQSRRRLL